MNQDLDANRPSGADAKSGLHPRNRHRGRYDLAALCAASPGLSTYVVPAPDGTATIDFSRPAAVKALNRALLQHCYGLAYWDLPAGYLCPPIPGRADYVHHLADLLAGANASTVPRGSRVRVLDVGVGANCIYPLLGHAEYGWRFVGADIDPAALESARRIVDRNGLGTAIELRRQSDPGSIFRGLLRAGEVFAATLCNPPFHASLEAAQAGSRRKWRGLGRPSGATAAPRLNFGGQGGELWCPGGESAFVQRMIAESVGVAHRCSWFSTLVSKEANLSAVLRALDRAGVAARRTVDMAQGQKRSRFVAWTFLDARELADRAAHWRGEA